MIRDARTLGAGDVLSALCCVIGAGPAGLALATDLDRAGIATVVLESGGDLDHHDPAQQALAEAAVVGDPLIDLSLMRRHQVGGNSSAWSVKMPDGRIGVRYTPLDAVDFEARPRLGLPGWPFDRAHLHPWYERAQVTCGAGPYLYDAQEWERELCTAWPLDPTELDTKIFQFGPAVAIYGERRAQLEMSGHSTLLHHAHVVDLHLNDAHRAVESVTCRRGDGSEFTVAADTVVIATGGIENARLLLLANSQQPAGIGNGHDLVGRYLHDHPLIEGGHLAFGQPSWWSHSALYDMRLVDGTSVLGYTALSPVALQRHGLLGLSATFFPRPSPRRSRTVGALKEAELRRAAGLPITGKVALASDLLAGADYVPVAFYRKWRYQQSLYHSFGRGGWSTMPGLAAKFTRMEIVHQVEQRPEAANRVVLGSTRDALGCPRAEVHWRFSREDATIAARGRRVIAAELERAGVGRVSLPADDDLPGYGSAAGTAHHMGTTRMHDDPTRGVVDRNTKVHGVENLYVAGSSVFPNGGYANPTLTIVAMAHRLADHLSARLGS